MQNSKVSAIDGINGRDTPEKAHDHLCLGARVRYSGMGGLVQQPAAPGAHWKQPAGRSRGTPLRHAGAVSRGDVTQTK